MGNKLKDAIVEKVITPHLNNYMHPVKAKVIDYDHIYNFASVMFESPNSLGHIELLNVPVQLGSGGVHSAGPFPGDEVWVMFSEGDIKKPKIVALADEEYKTLTRELRQKHSRKGAYVPDLICERTDW